MTDKIDAAHIFQAEPAPPKSLSFSLGDGEGNVATLTVKDGKMTFEGDADVAAEQLVEKVNQILLNDRKRIAELEADLDKQRKRAERWKRAAERWSSNLQAECDRYKAPFKNHDDLDWEWLDKNLPRGSIQAEFWHNRMREFRKAMEAKDE